MAESMREFPKSWYYEKAKAKIQCADCNKLIERNLKLESENKELKAQVERLKLKLFETAQYHVTIINRINQKLFNTKHNINFIKQDSILALKNVSKEIDSINDYLTALQSTEKESK